MAIPDTKRSKLIDAYLRDGLSVAQTAAKFHVSPSTVIAYLKKSGVARRSRSDAVTRWHMTKFHKKPVRIKESLSFEDEKLRLSGVMLYWAEGCKGRGTVKFVNSDPDMIRLFIKFLRNICGIWEDRLKLLVHMYPDQDEDALMVFWSGVTGVQKKNFYKSFVHAGNGGTYKRKSQYGTLTVNYSDKKLLDKINFWISEWRGVC
jgi:hypothetical protein